METSQNSSDQPEVLHLITNDSKDRGTDACTNDGTMDMHGKPAVKKNTGGWRAGILLLVSEGLAALASTGVEVNMVLFGKMVLRQSNADAANTFSTWMGTLNMCTLLGAFLSDSYLGRYFTCMVFQVVLVIGLVLLSLSTQLFMLEPKGCGKLGEMCNQPSPPELASFYISAYLLALGSGAIEPALATLGADQFDEDDSEEKESKSAFFSYYYVALNMGSLIAETLLAYIENVGRWALAFWISTACGFLALVSLLIGTWRYRHIRPSGNPISRFCQVIVACVRKMKMDVLAHGEELYEVPAKDDKECAKRILHTTDFKYLDRAAVVTPSDKILLSIKGQAPNPWHLCTITQVEEVKCVLRLLPIWFCTIVASLVFVQVLSLFVEQGAAMNTKINSFHLPPASMTTFDIISTSAFIICYDKLLIPLYTKITKKKPNPPSELQRIGIGMAIAILAMIVAGLVEQRRLEYANQGGETSSLSIFWQTPQYVLVGVSEAFIYVAQWEFFASQTPDGLKSLGLGLAMSSSALGSYLCSVILTVVMKFTSKNGKPGWIPLNLNEGHMDRFFFLSAVLIAMDLLFFITCANRFKSIMVEKRDKGQEEMQAMP